MAQFCPSCGARLDQPQRFCTRCGALLSTAGPAWRGGRLPSLIFGLIGGLVGVLLLVCITLLLLTLRDSSAGPLAVATIIPTSTSVLSPTPPEPQANAASGVLVYDDFSTPDSSALTAQEDENSRTAFADGIYLFEVKAADTLSWAITDHTYDDLVIEADTEVSAESKVVAAGLLFHYHDSRNFYLFSIASDGYYALEMLHNDIWQTLIDWTESDAINATHNTLRVETKGDRITLKANGRLLEVTEDDSLSGGDAGLAVSSFESAQVTVCFDNLLITRSP